MELCFAFVPKQEQNKETRVKEKFFCFLFFQEKEARALIFPNSAKVAAFLLCHIGKSCIINQNHIFWGGGSDD